MDLSKYTPEIINTLQELIRIKTVLDTPVEGGPFGKGNKECLERILQICEQLGFKVKNLDGYCGYAEIGSGEELVGIIGHLDVVPEGNLSSWKYPPYSGVVVDGELWGRGTWDDKGPTVISIYAIKALMDSGFVFNKRVRLIFGCNEESGSLCMEHYLKVDEPISYGVSPDASFPVIFAEKTINNIELKGKAINNNDVKLISLSSGTVINAVPDKCEFTLKVNGNKQEVIAKINTILSQNNIEYKITDENDTISYEVYGKAAHGSTPDVGVNAASFALLALNQVCDNSFVKFYYDCIGICVHGEKLNCYVEDEYGPIAVNVGLVSYENDNYSIKINSRLPFNTNSEEMVLKIKEKVEPYGVEVILHSSSTGFKIDPESMMIKCLVNAYQEVTKDYKTAPICCAGGTYAREFSNCVAFGPEMEGYGEVIIHQPNERIQIRAIEDIMKIYFKAYADLITKVSFK